MIPYEVDPSLHPAEPMPPQLDDGFSPPEDAQQPRPKARDATVDPALWRKSEF